MSEPRHTMHLWAGTFPSEERLHDYFQETYDEEDEDAPLSQFAADLGAERYDHDFTERGYADRPVTPRELAEGHSYAEQWAGTFADRVAAAGLESINTLATMYERPDDPLDFAPTTCRGDGYALHYLGAVPVRP